MIGELSDLPARLPARSPAEIVAHCGGYSKAVDRIMDFGRALWDLAFVEDSGATADPTGKYQIIDPRRLPYERFRLDKLLLPVLLGHLHAKELAAEVKDPSQTRLDPRVFSPNTLVRQFVGDIRPEPDLRYFVRRNIRRTYRREQSSETAHFFHLLADAVNSALNSKTFFASHDADGQEAGPHCHYKAEFVPYMMRVLGGDRHWRRASRGVGEAAQEPDILKMFVECCRNVGYVRADYRKRGHVNIRTQSLDAEYLIARLFGMPTAIAGLDDLFGGGGLILAEDLDADDGGESPKGKRLYGRTLLIKGRFGTGKSLLSMQLAVEVARKGGLAWLMPLEQTAEECLYTLESMSVLPGDNSVLVATTWKEALKALYPRGDDRGALIIYNAVSKDARDGPGEVSKDAYRDFLAAFAGKAESTTRYPLRVIGVDPINSIAGQSRQRADQRAVVFEMLEEVRRHGTNVLLVAEEGSRRRNELLFEENIADTVIHLSINKHQNSNYAQRYFEVTKSRFQREQRGEHAFSIVPGQGFRIIPSTAAVHARIATRRLSVRTHPIKIEPSSLTDALGAGSVLSGDVIVFQGPRGTFKTMLSVPFLLGSDAARENEDGAARGPVPGAMRRQRKSLFVATRDNEPTIRRTFQEFEAGYLRERASAPGAKTLEDHVIVSPLRHGYVQPGYILQSLQSEFDKVEMEAGRTMIDRVVIDNIAHWEMSCPFVRDDEAFGNTLLDFLRRRNVTTLLICGEPSRDVRSVLQQSILDSADCLLRFSSRSEQDGRQRIFVRVVKTHNLQPAKDYFELTRENGKIKFV